MNIMKYLIIILCALGCAIMSYRYQSAKKQTTETRRPLRYYKNHIVVGIWPTKNVIVLASDSNYINITVTDYELNSVTLGDTVK